MNPVPCGPCGPVVTQVPGPSGIQGIPGPAGSVTVLTVAGYGSSASAPYTLATSSSAVAPALLYLTPTQPQITLPTAGTYIIRARARFDGTAVTLTTQTLTTYLYDVGAGGIVPNTNRTFAFLPQITATGTLAEIVTPDVQYTVAAATTIQLWGGVNAPTGAGTITCVDADIFAMQIVP